MLILGMLAIVGVIIIMIIMIKTMIGTRYITHGVDLHEGRAAMAPYEGRWESSLGHGHIHMQGEVLLLLLLLMRMCGDSCCSLDRKVVADSHDWGVVITLVIMAVTVSKGIIIVIIVVVVVVMIRYMERGDHYLIR